MSARPIRVVPEADGTLLCVAPSVGFVRGLPEVGDVIVGGRPFARLETLGRVETLALPAGTSGRVVERLVSNLARAPIGYGGALLRLDPRVAGASEAASSAVAAAAELVFRAPMSGRFYARPAPTKPALVEVGGLVESGQGVCLLEVMKTFNRVTYGGEGLPARARVVRIVPADGDDVARGAVLFELAPA